MAVLNDDSTPVSQVHLGLVFLVEPLAGRVRVREIEKLEGEVLGLEAMRRHYLNMESWSQLAYDDLVGGARHPGGSLEALERLRLGTGHDYQPEVVESLARVLARGKQRAPSDPFTSKPDVKPG